MYACGFVSGVVEVRGYGDVLGGICFFCYYFSFVGFGSVSVWFGLVVFSSCVGSIMVIISFGWVSDFVRFVVIM